MTAPVGVRFAIALAVGKESHTLNKEEFMVQTYLSLLAAGLLAAAQPAAGGAQTEGRQAPAKPAAAIVVNINTAPAAELETLPGVGPKTAARIIEYRQKNGPFKKIEELMNVRGMGEKNFLKLKPRLTVSTPKAEREHP